MLNIIRLGAISLIQEWVMVLLYQWSYHNKQQQQQEEKGTTHNIISNY